MASLLIESAASTLLVIDEAGGANLTEIARAAGTPVSTVQRALERLVADGVLKRVAPRGRFEIAGRAPRRALRQLAAWRLGSDRQAKGVVKAIREDFDSRGVSTDGLKAQ